MSTFNTIDCRYGRLTPICLGILLGMEKRLNN
jgi:hypothetical protein